MNIEIKVDEDKVIAAVVETIVTQGRYYDEDGDVYPTPLAKALEARVTKLLDDEVRRILGDEFEAAMRARIEPMIDEVVAQGFPKFSPYGDRMDGHVPFRTVVGEAIAGMFKPSNHGRGWAAEEARRAFDRHVGAAFKEEAEEIRKSVRAYVDEHLAGSVVKALREAVGLRS